MLDVFLSGFLFGVSVTLWVENAAMRDNRLYKNIIPAFLATVGIAILFLR